MGWTDEARGRDVGIPDEELTPEQEEEERESYTLRRAKEIVGKKNLPPNNYMSPESMSEIEFPQDIKKMELDTLTQAMADWTQVVNYADTYSTECEVEKTARTNQFNYEKAKQWTILRTSGKSEEDTRKGVEKIPSVIKAKREMEIAVAKSKISDSLLRGYDRNYKMLSRELTKRGIIIPGSGNGYK